MTTTEPSESFQIPVDVAERYESAFVPAFFAQWAPILSAAAGVAPGHRVLDVACGTGIVARTVAAEVMPDGSVIGVDLNEAMLTVARRVSPEIEFRQGEAAALPFESGSFDVVLSQMALMFFPDRPASLGEMARVTAPMGAVAVLVPRLLSTYFVCGDLDGLTALVESAGLRIAAARTEVGTYRAPSVAAFVTTEVESTPLVQRITEDVYRRIRADAHDVLASFTTSDGRVEAPFEANLVVAHRP